MEEWLKKRRRKHQENWPSMWKQVLQSKETKFKLFSLLGKKFCVLREHHPHSEAWWWEYHAMGMFAIIRTWEIGQNRKNEKWCEKHATS